MYRRLIGYGDDGRMGVLLDLLLLSYSVVDDRGNLITLLGSMRGREEISWARLIVLIQNWVVFVLFIVIVTKLCVICLLLFLQTVVKLTYSFNTSI